MTTDAPVPTTPTAPVSDAAPPSAPAVTPVTAAAPAPTKAAPTKPAADTPAQPAAVPTTAPATPEPAAAAAPAVKEAVAATPPTPVTAEKPVAAKAVTAAPTAAEKPAAATPTAPVKTLPAPGEPTSHLTPVLTPNAPAVPTPHAIIGRIPVVDVAPTVEGGRWPAKAVVGEVVPVTATVFREGHDQVAASAVLVAPDGTVKQMKPMRDIAPGLDQFLGHVQPDAEGEWTFRVEAWSDPYATWVHDASVKIAAGVDVDLMLEEGVLLFERITAPDEQAKRSAADRFTLEDAATQLADHHRSADARLAVATSMHVREALARNPLRDLVSPSADYPLRVSRKAALAASWYEIFPRSEGAWQDQFGTWHSGTFNTAAERLPAIADMGFDVVYLTPISPIGTQFRKGRNNTLDAKPGDPGSPYAIGSADGGHDAIHPELGTEADFIRFVGRARELGLEVALDLALQCSPDHPWVTEHPEWLRTRADGTIAYAENPPKKYQDIYPLYFDIDPIGLREEVLRILLVWIERGVTMFRVDNPHTKPLDFWEWVLAEVHARHPEVLFLSEAFTKPAMMATLARIGFHQSYTYFTWRNSKDEILEYLGEVSGPSGSVMRPSFWPTTHDILPPYLQHGGVAGFAVRAVLAATGSPTWGIYNGYELIENVPRPGVDEQVDNEKYEFKPRNWERASAIGIAALLKKLNLIRAEHPALQQLRNLTVHASEHSNLLAYSRRISADHLPLAASGHTPQHGNLHDDTILVVLNIDPWGTSESHIHLDWQALGLHRPDGLPDGEPFFTVRDLMTGETFHWNEHPFVRLDPRGNVAHIFAVSQN